MTVFVFLVLVFNCFDLVYDQEAADVTMEALTAIPGQIGQYCLFTVETCAYAARFVRHSRLLALDVSITLFYFLICRLQWECHQSPEDA